MKRVLFSIPVFFLLLPWLFISAVILGVGLASNPFALLLLLPMGVLFAVAFGAHRYYHKRERHFGAAVAASTVLVAPLVAIVVAFFAWGQDLALQQAKEGGLVDLDTVYDCSLLDGCEARVLYPNRGF